MHELVRDLLYGLPGVLGAVLSEEGVDHVARGRGTRPPERLGELQNLRDGALGRRQRLCERIGQRVDDVERRQVRSPPHAIAGAPEFPAAAHQRQHLMRAALLKHARQRPLEEHVVALARRRVFRHAEKRVRAHDGRHQSAALKRHKEVLAPLCAERNAICRDVQKRAHVLTAREPPPVELAVQCHCKLAVVAAVAIADEDVGRRIVAVHAGV
mmetsp:Transcript_920/g.3444  ORF Transcript_920/g.3444 Transcript_920/m.3444 type:complete len:213 (-) Transcript_920:431-1069(-)